MEQFEWPQVGHFGWPPGVGRHLIQGPLFDSHTHTDLTKVRTDQLTAFDFKALPFKDAMVVRHGDGRRKLAVFADPNCGYCKKLETELKAVKDVTVYVFPLPVLGEDSKAKARNIWCASQPGQSWQAWMLDNTAPPRAMGSCDTFALDRNLALGEKHHVSGTPTLVFEDNSRTSSLLTSEALEKRLALAGTSR